jgi:hypothetical protein
MVNALTSKKNKPSQVTLLIWKAKPWYVKHAHLSMPFRTTTMRQSKIQWNSFSRNYGPNKRFASLILVAYVKQHPKIHVSPEHTMVVHPPCRTLHEHMNDGISPNTIVRGPRIQRAYYYFIRALIPTLRIASRHRLYYCDIEHSQNISSSLTAQGAFLLPNFANSLSTFPNICGSTVCRRVNQDLVFYPARFTCTTSLSYDKNAKVDVIDYIL